MLEVRAFKTITISSDNLKCLDSNPAWEAKHYRTGQVFPFIWFRVPSFLSVINTLRSAESLIASDTTNGLAPQHLIYYRRSVLILAILITRISIFPKVKQGAPTDTTK
jgi:hypothetical protein